MSLYDGTWSQDIKSGQIQNIPSFEKGSKKKCALPIAFLCIRSLSIYSPYPTEWFTNVSERKGLFLFNNEEFNCSQSKYRMVITMKDKVDYSYLYYSFISLPKVLDLLPHFFKNNITMWKWKKKKNGTTSVYNRILSQSLWLCGSQ